MQSRRNPATQPSIFHSMVLWMNCALTIQVQMKVAKEKRPFPPCTKNNRGDDCPVSHGQAVHQLLAFLANHFGRLPANGISFLFKHTSGVLADSHPACLMKGRDSLVRCGQGFRKSVFKLFHLLIKNADDLAVVLQYNGCPIFLLHLFSSRNCHIYF